MVPVAAALTDLPAAMLTVAGGPGALAALAVTLALAGLVRGFTGFGTALVFMPVAAALIPAELAILILVTTGMAVWPVLVPGAWHAAAKREVAWMGAAALLFTPLGVALLASLPEAALRWAVAGAAAATLAALVSGWRHARPVGPAGLLGVGAASGLLGGATGLGGPPAILFYLAGPSGAARVRANTILFLCVLDVAIVTSLLARFDVTAAHAALCGLLAIPSLLATRAGQRLFHPARERLYRRGAYALIAASILAGLPLWR